MITIRHFQPDDAADLWDIFFHTVRKVNLGDYSQEQVRAWAPDDFDQAVWCNAMQALSPFVAEINGQVVGYADLQQSGLIDHFFCHYQYQGQGVGHALMTHLLEVGKAKGMKKIHAAVSLTARPFFERYGFAVIKEQAVERRGQVLCNFIMEKRF